MSLKRVRCELQWERPESELGVHADLAIARMLLALPARFRPAAMKPDAVGNHWEFTQLAPGVRPTREPGAAPTLVVTAKIRDDSEDEDDLEDFGFGDGGYHSGADQPGAWLLLDGPTGRGFGAAAGRKPGWLPKPE